MAVVGEGEKKESEQCAKELSTKHPGFVFNFFVLRDTRAKIKTPLTEVTHQKY